MHYGMPISVSTVIQGQEKGPRAKALSFFQ